VRGDLDQLVPVGDECRGLDRVAHVEAVTAAVSTIWCPLAVSAAASTAWRLRSSLELRDNERSWSMGADETSVPKGARDTTAWWCPSPRSWLT
jgi:hypothetical protein